MTGANSSPNGIDRAALSGPKALALDATGRVLVVNDAGNSRVLRFVQNQPPVLDGGGTYRVLAGSPDPLTIDLSATDPEGDPLGALRVCTDLALPCDGSVSLDNPSVSGTVLSYDASTDVAGTVIRLRVEIGDEGPRPETTSASVVAARPFKPCFPLEVR